MPQLKDLLQLLGLGTPFVVALAVYYVFKYIDKKASGQAKKAIVAWIENEKYQQIDLTAAVVGAFDNLYGAQLLRPRAIATTLIVSTISIILWKGFLRIPALVILINHPFMLRQMLEETVPPVFFSDYISLFVVRRCLVVARTSLIPSLLLAMMGAAAALIVATCGATMMFLFIALFELLSATPFQEKMTLLLSLGLEQLFLQFIKVMTIVFLPALSIHLWIPLFIVAATINRAIVYFFLASNFSMWFIKRGKDHPFEAIGMIASAVTFLAASALKGVTYLMGR